ncbi:halocyanin domain-containing protein [Natronomonas salina]|uniref:halocyanin domain-containing protein n=1 Tax=Natronomonas salina TaxID=1710540 RepID=UPI0015B399C5|nr:halocyanin domain-containing protein [Natronomonas salina]QLD87869.1 halocyanin domain-containing protein [Natronomonas salina]
MSAGTEQSSGGAAIEDGTEPTVGRRAFITGTVAAATAAGATAAGGTAAAQGEAYQGWFDDVDNYEGTVDYRGEDEVTVAVGAGDAGVLFDPPAILVDPGTTVVWEWTGVGGTHNVVHEPGEEGEAAFESDMYESEGETFEFTFDVEEGIFPYFCSPHRAVGMKGAVAVGNVDDELIEPSGGGSGGDGGGGQPLTTVDRILAGSGLLIGVALILAVVRPDTLNPDRD